MKNIFSFLILFLFSISFEEDEIIRIPYGLKEFENVKTKNGPISSKIIFMENTPTFNDWRDISPHTIRYIIQNIKNSELFSSNYFYNYQNLNNSIFIDINEKIFNTYWKDNDLIIISFICESLFRTKYIDNYIYSIGKDENNEKYTFFGGTPEHLINNLNNYTFGKSMIKNEMISFHAVISNITFEMADGKKLNLKLNEKFESTFEFSEELDAMLCVSKNYYDDFYKEYENYLKNINYKGFSLSFNIDDKIFNLSNLNGNSFDYITLCNRFILGKKFFELFDYREYNLETKKVNLYLNENKKYIFEKKDDKNKIINSNCKIDIILFCIFMSLTLITFAKSYTKNNGIEFYYNEKYILNY